MASPPLLWHPGWWNGFLYGRKHVTNCTQFLEHLPEYGHHFPPAFNWLMSQMSTYWRQWDTYGLFLHWGGTLGKRARKQIITSGSVFGSLASVANSPTGPGFELLLLGLLYFFFFWGYENFKLQEVGSGWKKEVTWMGLRVAVISLVPSALLPHPLLCEQHRPHACFHSHRHRGPHQIFPSVIHWIHEPNLTYIL